MEASTGEVQLANGFCTEVPTMLQRACRRQSSECRRVVGHAAPEEVYALPFPSRVYPA